MHDLVPARVINKIAELTGHRDIGLLESSLLKTVDHLLAPEWSAIYRVTGEHAAPPAFSTGLSLGEPLAEPVAASFADLTEMDGVISMPLLARTGQALGYVAIKRAGGLSDREQQMVIDIFRIYGNYSAVLRESQEDQLTGLLNRHTFDTELDRALEVARRDCRPVAGSAAPAPEKPVRVLLGEIDIDHFKRINDTYGHPYGDEVLLLIARLLRSNFRKSDLIYRFGGEEFVVIVVSEAHESATESFERLRRTIESHTFPQVGQVTVSIGVTEIRDVPIPVQLLGQADQALYYAKQHGRNRVFFYEDLVSRGEIEASRISGEVTMF
jgi:diguanylate cyclase (GGDEF)-like protein